MPLRKNKRKDNVEHQEESRYENKKQYIQTMGFVAHAADRIAIGNKGTDG